MTFKDKSDILTSWLGLISILIGAGVFYSQYLTEKRNSISDQQRAALEIFSTYNQEYIKPRNQFYNLKQKIGVEIRPMLNLVGNIDQIQKAIETKQRELMVQYIRNDNAEADIDSLVSFYNQVEACVEVNICDALVVHKLFAEEAYEIWYYLDLYISNKEKFRMSYASGLKKVMQNPIDETQITNSVRDRLD